MRTVRFRFAAALCMILVMTAARSADNDDLVGRVRDGHRAARESVRSLTAMVIIEEVHPRQGVREQGRYWRSGNTARLQQGLEGLHTQDALMKGGEIRTVGRTWATGKQAPTGIAIRQPGTALFGGCDVWTEMLIELTGPDSAQISLDRVFETADGPVRADRDTLDGRECIRLRYSHTFGRGTKEQTTQWHDVSRNYLICKLTVEYSDDPSSHRGVVQVTDFIEPSPGVVFPVRVRRDHYQKGELSQSRLTTLSGVVINKPIPATDLELPALPRGTILTDQIENKQGPVDSDWKPIGVMKPLAPVLPPANRAPLATPVESGPSTSEPVSSSRWVIAGSVAVLLLAAGVALVRRLLAGRHSASEVAS